MLICWIRKPIDILYDLEIALLIVSVDVDSTSSLIDVSQPACTKSRWTTLVEKVNESFGSLPGNPFDENKPLSDCGWVRVLSQC